MNGVHLHFALTTRWFSRSILRFFTRTHTLKIDLTKNCKYYFFWEHESRTRLGVAFALSTTIQWRPIICFQLNFLSAEETLFELLHVMIHTEPTGNLYASVWMTVISTGVRTISCNDWRRVTKWIPHGRHGHLLILAGISMWHRRCASFEQFHTSIKLCITQWRQQQNGEGTKRDKLGINENPLKTNNRDRIFFFGWSIAIRTKWLIKNSILNKKHIVLQHSPFHMNSFANEYDFQYEKSFIFLYLIF